MSKYSILYPPLVERVYNEERQKYKRESDSIKSAKTRLHQMYGAYNQGNIHKKALALLSQPIVDIKTTSTEIMTLHASTKERLPSLGDIYAFIEHHAPEAKKILDIGCGFNPFSIPFMANKPESYHAFDIDTETRDLLNTFFAHLGIPQTADCADLIVETPAIEADLALMYKLIPVLEMQKPGRGFEVLRNLNAKTVIVTYPLKSLGGRNKGMEKNYAAQFEGAALDGKLGSFKIVDSATIGTELVYILNQYL